MVEALELDVLQLVGGRRIVRDATVRQHVAQTHTTPLGRADGTHVPREALDGLVLHELLATVASALQRRRDRVLLKLGLEILEAQAFCGAI